MTQSSSSESHCVACRHGRPCNCQGECLIPAPEGRRVGITEMPPQRANARGPATKIGASMRPQNTSLTSRDLEVLRGLADWLVEFRKPPRIGHGHPALSDFMPRAFGPTLARLERLGLVDSLHHGASFDLSRRYDIAWWVTDAGHAVLKDES